jgi:NTP pyrophosphatase (non-canonical NTP hydrolase)
MDLNEAVRRTEEVAEAIERKRGKRWDAKTRLIDLMEEAGELANAVLVEQGNKPLRRKKSDLVDSVCDVLFAVFMMANVYDIDLEKEYLKVLDHIKERDRKGDFRD